MKQNPTNNLAVGRLLALNNDFEDNNLVRIQQEDPKSIDGEVSNMSSEDEKKHASEENELSDLEEDYEMIHTWGAESLVYMFEFSNLTLSSISEEMLSISNSIVPKPIIPTSVDADKDLDAIIHMNNNFIQMMGDITVQDFKQFTRDIIDGNSLTYFEQESKITSDQNIKKRELNKLSWFVEHKEWAYGLHQGLVPQVLKTVGDIFGVLVEPRGNDISWKIDNDSLFLSIKTMGLTVQDKQKLDAISDWGLNNWRNVKPLGLNEQDPTDRKRRNALVEKWLNDSSIEERMKFMDVQRAFDVEFLVKLEKGIGLSFDKPVYTVSLKLDNISPNLSLQVPPKALEYFLSGSDRASSSARVKP